MISKMKKVKFLQILIFSVSFIGVSHIATAVACKYDKKLNNKDHNVLYQNNYKLKQNNKDKNEHFMEINNINKNLQNYNNTTNKSKIFKDIKLEDFNIKKPPFYGLDMKYENKTTNEKSYNFDKKIHIRNDENKHVYPKYMNCKESGVIDPQYEVVKGPMRYQYKLNGVLLYTRNNRVGKYKNVKTREIFNELPAADPKFEIKKDADGVFYYYQGERAYEIIDKGNQIIYKNLKNQNLKIYGIKGLKEYYINDTPVESLPIPESEILKNDEKIKKERLAKIFYYKSPKYYELLQKSQFFKPMNEEEFEMAYSKEHNQYNHIDFYDLVIMENVVNNMFERPKNYKFVSNLEDKDDDCLTLEQKKVKNKFEGEIVNKIKAILKNISNLQHSKNLNNINDDAIEHPVYKVITKSDLSFYCLNGKIKYYKLKNKSGYYDINNNYFEKLPFFIGNKKTFIKKGRDGKLYSHANKFEVIEDNGKIWYLKNGQKDFYFEKGNNAIKYNDFDEINIKNDSCSFFRRRNLNYKNKINYKFEIAEDPRYEVIEDAGQKVYFFEGFPKYVKTEDGGYYRFSDGKFYENLPTVDEEDYYQYFKNGNKLYCYINDNTIYEVTEEKKGFKTKIFYSLNGKKIFYVIKGKRDIKFKYSGCWTFMTKIPSCKFFE